jgi:hypothetical protein
MVNFVEFDETIRRDFSDEILKRVPDPSPTQCCSVA